MKAKIRKFLRNLLGYDGEIDSLKQETALNKEGIERLATLEDKMSALQAVDVDFHGYGNIVIIARIGKQDIVKIIPVKKAMKMKDYIYLAKSLETRYGAEPEYWDAPDGMGKYIKDLWERG